MALPVNYRIEPLADIELLRQCMEVQKRAWGFSSEDLLPLRMFVVCTKIGGQVFGALDGNNRVLGFVNALPGFREGRVYLHSHMMGVLPEFQNLGIGRKLKLAQLEDALQRDIERIEWTFDPLEARNARFNIELLGTICRRYYVNAYGITSSPLHGGMPTDRLVAEWHLRSDRVKSRIGLEPSAARPNRLAVSVKLPLDVGELRSKKPESALKWQMEFRGQILELFDKGYCVTGFEVDEGQQQIRYLLEEFNAQALGL